MDDERKLALMRKKKKPRLLPKRFKADMCKILNLRWQNKKYLGIHAGSILCLDNIGTIFSQTDLETKLKYLLKGLKKVSVSEGVFKGIKYSSGYAALTFDTIESAVEAMARIDNLYIVSADYPVPRPLLSHFPMWKNFPWENDSDVRDIYGHFLKTTGHFIHKDTIDYPFFQNWKDLQNTISEYKSKLMDEFVDDLAKIMESIPSGEASGSKSRENIINKNSCKDVSVIC